MSDRRIAAGVGKILNTLITLGRKSLDSWNEQLSDLCKRNYWSMLKSVTIIKLILAFLFSLITKKRFYIYSIMYCSIVLYWSSTKYVVKLCFMYKNHIYLISYWLFCILLVIALTKKVRYDVLRLNICVQEFKTL